jgi:hypothetical protein
MLSIEICLGCFMLFCVMCVIVLYCPVLHCSTVPPGINPFAVNNNNNNNNNNNYNTDGPGSVVNTCFTFG